MAGPEQTVRDPTHVEAVFRQVYGQAVTTLVRVFGDITLAEDAVQDAFLVASDRWPERGVPPNPAGWIITTAKNRAIDVTRREIRGRQLVGQLDPTPGKATVNLEPDDGPVADDQLRLIFICCHPALRIEHRVALTLRLLGGLTVAEVARSFLVSESTMAKRLVRAKHKIKANNIPYRVPDAADLPDRLQAVLSVLYLIYNTGADDPERSFLRADAIRLSRALMKLLPDEPEAAGLLALLVLSESRAATRIADGAPVLLRDQDRRRWDRSLIAEGHQIVRTCIKRGRPGTYQLQAAIQAVHCDAPTFEDTDWPQIVVLYDQLMAIAPTAVVALNRAIALGEADGPQIGLTALEALTDLDHYHLFHAARATMLRRLGDEEAARAAFATAAELAPTTKDHRFLTDQLTGHG